jgi:hypothetical protein
MSFLVGAKIVLLVVLAALFALQAATAVALTRPDVVHPIPSSIPTLRNAVALGKLVLIDSASGVAAFRVKCGWYVKPKRKVVAGLWKVTFRGVEFGWETYPNGPASGISHTVSRATWQQLAQRDGWSGTLYLAGRTRFISNGPTTDICAGVLG